MQNNKIGENNTMQNTEINKDNTLSKEIEKMSEKGLSEVRSECVSKLKSVQAKLKEETRPLTSEEDKQCDDLAAKIKMVDSEMKRRENVLNDYNKISDVLSDVEKNEHMFKADESHVGDDSSSNQEFKQPIAERARKSEPLIFPNGNMFATRTEQSNFTKFMERFHPEILALKRSAPNISEKFKQFFAKCKGKGDYLMHCLHNNDSLKAPIAERAHTTVEDLGGNVNRYMLGNVVSNLFASSHILQKCSLEVTPDDVYVSVSDSVVEMEAFTDGQLISIDKTEYSQKPITVQSLAKGISVAQTAIDKGGINLMDDVQARLQSAVRKKIEEAIVTGIRFEQNPILGLSETTNVYTSDSSYTIPKEGLYSIVEQIEDAGLNTEDNSVLDNCVWVMSKKLYLAIVAATLASGESAYSDKKIQNFQLARIMNYPVYCPTVMQQPEPGGVLAYFGDMSGITVQLAKQFELRESQEDYVKKNLRTVTTVMRIGTKVTHPGKIVKVLAKEE